MRILRAWIDDPTIQGECEPPLVCVETDAYPDQTTETWFSNDGWIQSKYGAFVRFDHETSDVDAGKYNIRFAGQSPFGEKFPPIVDIILTVGDSQAADMFALPLNRARQLVRKHAPEWRLLLSDNEAQQGSMLWTPKMIEPKCRFWMGQNPCGYARDVTYVRKNGIDVPLCESHLKLHNNQAASVRRNAS